MERYFKPNPKSNTPNGIFARAMDVKFVFVESEETKDRLEAMSMCEAYVEISKKEFDSLGKGFIVVIDKPKGLEIGGDQENLEG